MAELSALDRYLLLAELLALLSAIVLCLVLMFRRAAHADDAYHFPMLIAVAATVWLRLQQNTLHEKLQ